MKKIYVTLALIASSFVVGVAVANFSQPTTTQANQNSSYAIQIAKLNKLLSTDMDDFDLSTASGYLYGASLFAPENSTALHTLWQSLNQVGAPLLQDGELIALLAEIEIACQVNLPHTDTLAAIETLALDKATQMQETDFDWLGDEQYTVSLIIYDEQIPEHPYYYDAEGTEFYLITPRYTSTVVDIYAQELEDAQLVRKEKIATVPAGEQFILHCNISDLYSNVSLDFTHLGKTVSCSPHVSLMDGSVQAGEHGRDVTEYYKWMYHDHE